MAQLQDKFHKHMVEAGVNLERWVSSDRKYIDSARFKAETIQEEIRELEKVRQEKEKVVSTLKNIESVPSKEVPNNPNLVYVPKKAFEAVKGLAKAGIAVRENQESLSQAKVEKSTLEMENKSLERELVVEKATNKDLEKENHGLKDENKSL